MRILKLKKNDPNLPIFPSFVALGSHHQAPIADITKGNPLYSDYNFISMWSWDHQNRLKISSLNGNLVIRFQDYVNPKEYFYSFFGTNKVDETAKILLGFSAREGVGELKLLPQFVIEKLINPKDFIITEDRDNFDYIVAINEMVNLYSDEKKRWSLNQFMKKNAEQISMSELNLKDKTTAKHIFSLAELWSEQNGTSADFKSNEGRAIKKMLSEHHHIDTSNLHVVGVYLGDKLKAFSISEILKDGFAIGHYKKTDRTYRGLGVALERYTAMTLKQRGVAHLNHEQDLGIEGLRRAKMASHPVYFLKKYKLSLARTDNI